MPTYKFQYEGAADKINKDIKALDNLASSVQKVEKANSGPGSPSSLASFGRSFTATAAAMQGVFQAASRAASAAYTEISKGAKEFGRYEIAVARVSQSLKDYNLFTKSALEGHKKFTTELSRRTTLSQPAILQTMAILAAGGIAGKQLQRSASAVKDLAAEFGQDPDAIARNLVAAKLGATDYLRRYKIVVPKGLAPEQKFDAALDFIERNFSGQAAARLDTSAGQLENFQNRIADLRREIGGPFLAAVAAAAKEVTPFVTSLTDAAAAGDGKKTEYLVVLAQRLAQVAVYMAKIAGYGKNALTFVGKTLLPDYRVANDKALGADRSYDAVEETRALGVQERRNQLVNDYHSGLRQELIWQKQLILFSQSQLEIDRKAYETEKLRVSQRKQLGLTGEEGVASSNAAAANSIAFQEQQVAQLKYDEALAKLRQSATDALDSGGEGPNTARNEQTAKWISDIAEGGAAAAQALSEMKTSAFADQKAVEELAVAANELAVAQANVAETAKQGALETSFAAKQDALRLATAQKNAAVLDAQTEAASTAAALELDYGRGLASKTDLLRSALDFEEKITAAQLEQIAQQQRANQSAEKAVELGAQRNALLNQSVAAREKINEEIRKEEAGLDRIRRAQEFAGDIYRIRAETTDSISDIRRNAGAGTVESRYLDIRQSRRDVEFAQQRFNTADQYYTSLYNQGADRESLTAASEAQNRAAQDLASSMDLLNEKVKAATGFFAAVSTAGELGQAGSGLVSNLKGAFGGLNPGVDKGLDTAGQLLDRFNALIGIVQSIQTIMGIFQGVTATAQLTAMTTTAASTAATAATLATYAATTIPMFSIMALAAATPEVLGTGFASGGPVTGGVPGMDSVPALLMPDEHVITAADVRAMGGQKRTAAIIRAYADHSVRRMADGGPVMPETYYTSHGSSGMRGSGRGQVIEVNLDGRRMFSRYMGSMDAEKHVVNIVDNRRGRGGNG